MPPKKSAPAKGSGFPSLRELARNKKVVTFSILTFLFVLLYTRIVQVEAIDNGFQVTYHSDKRERAFDALKEIKSTTGEQVDRVAK